MHLSRRSVLAGGALGLAAACTHHRSVVRRPTADDLLIEQAAIREEALLRLYDAALAAFPALAPVLSPVRADHVQHQVALGRQQSDEPSATADRRLLGSSAKSALVNLAALERSTADQHRAAAVQASRAKAPLLASLAACEAAHLALL